MADLTLENFRTLLQLQEVDSSLDQATHRRAHLPAHEAMAAVQKEAGLLRPQMDAAVSVRDELAAKQMTLEAEVAAVEKRIAEINLRLYDGSAKIAPDDALAMSQEVRHLNERRSRLEDDELEVMEALEPADKAAAALEEQGKALSKRMQEAQAEMGAAQAEIDQSIMGLRTQRTELAAAIPASLLSEYDKLRAHLGGVAVARLVGNSCSGCHLTLAPSELAEIQRAPEAALLHCEECGRLLVR
jgi:predicted  nucleic acid-binding Zn-ribbon protein